MPALYYKYRIDFNNTIVGSSNTSFTLGFNEAQVYSGTSINLNGNLYNYRFDGRTIITSDSKTITHYTSYLKLLEDFNIIPSLTGASSTTGVTVGNLSVSGTTTLNGVVNEIQNTSYGTPRDSAIPTFNTTFPKVQVLGNVSVPLSTVNGWNVNWGLSNNSLYTFSFSTSDGSPTWFKDLLGNTTKYMNSANPYIVINGSGINNLDDSYWVNYINGGDFVMVSKTRNLTLYFPASTSSYIPKTFSTNFLGIDSLNRVYVTGIKSNLYGTEFTYATSTGVSTSTSTTPVTKVTMTTESLPLGLYKISSNWAWTHNSTSSAARFDLTLNNVRIGQMVDVTPDLTTNIKLDSKSLFMVLSGVNVITLRYWNQLGSTSISDANIELIRVK